MSNQTFTVATFKERKANKTPVTMLTAYDYSTAQLVEEAGIDTLREAAQEQYEHWKNAQW